MKRGTQIKSASGILFLALPLLTTEVAAQAMFVQPGAFLIEQRCQAFDSIRNPVNGVDLDVNTSYTAYGENKPEGGSHAYIGFGSERKWVSLDCGSYPGGRPGFAGQPGGGTGTATAECLPFFDDIDNPVAVAVGGNADITPPAPPIEPFGQAVNAVCGSPGSDTTAAEFKQLMRDHPQVLQDIMAYTGNKVFADRPAQTDAEAYLEDLTQAWYAVHAFDHIFCGQPTGAHQIGGLHYQGRYQQLQADQTACRLPNFHQNEVVEGSIYTMGVRMKRASGGWAEFDFKGYGLTLSATDLFKLATRAFKENPTVSTTSTGCNLRVEDGGTGYDVVFVRRANGIRTFYPDATPDLARNPPCANPLVLASGTGGPVQPPTGGGSQAQVMTVGRFRIEVISSDDKGVVLRIGDAE